MLFSAFYVAATAVELGAWWGVTTVAGNVVIIYTLTVYLTVMGVSTATAAGTERMSLADMVASFMVSNGVLLVAYKEVVQGGIYALLCPEVFTTSCYPANVSSVPPQ